MKKIHACPVCGTDMTNPAGNVYACPNCDFTATEHQLERIREAITPSK